MLVGLLFALPLLAACAQDEDGEQAAPRSRAATTTPSTPTPPPFTEGVYFVYIKAVDGAARTITFDRATLFVGDAAQTAAIEDGVIEPGGSLDSDFYIRNRNQQLRTLPFVADVRIRLVNWPACCDNPVDGEIGAFVAAFGPDGKTDLYRGPDTQYAITIEGGAIVRIREQYLP